MYIQKLYFNGYHAMRNALASNLFEMRINPSSQEVIAARWPPL